MQITYNIHELPTAAHKAGLAGLVLVLQAGSMSNAIKSYDASSATFDFSEEDLDKLFKYVYKSKTFEKKDGSTYQGPACQYMTDLGLAPIWVNLWCRCIMENRVPAALKIFKEYKPIKDNPFDTKSCEIPTSLLYWSESATSEGVEIKGFAHHNFLLHFSIAASLVYVPQTYEVEHGKRVLRDKGYAVAIPEVVDLESFVEDYKDVVRSLPDEGQYKPNAALVFFPTQAALEYLAAFIEHSVHKGRLSFSIASIFVSHFQKPKQVCYLSSGIISLDRDIIEKYRVIRSNYKNYTFKSVLLTNLINGDPWYLGFAEAIGKASKEDWPFLGFDVFKFNRNREKTMDVDVLNDVISRFVYFQLKSKAGNRNKTDDPTRQQIAEIAQDEIYSFRSKQGENFINCFVNIFCSVPQFQTKEQNALVANALATDWRIVKNFTMLALCGNCYLNKEK